MGRGLGGEITSKTIVQDILFKRMRYFSASAGPLSQISAFRGVY